MKKILMIIAVCLLTLSCMKDNLDGPNAALFGECVDKTTGELIGQDIYNGSFIRYAEQGYSTEKIQYMYFKTDGTYRNSQMFSGTYNIYLNQSNFVPDTLKNVVIKPGENHLELRLTPYITLFDVTIEQASATTVRATFKLRQNTADKVKKIGIFVHREAAVGNGTCYDKWEVAIDNDVPDTYTMNIGLNLADTATEVVRGKSYYFRVGALSAAPAAKYNYAPAVKLTLW